MRAFMVLCFIAAAYAAPQYNYQQPAAAPAPAPVQSFAPAPAPSFAPAPAPSFAPAPAPSFAPAPAFSHAAAPAAHAPAAHAHGQQAAAGPPVWNKQYFIHAAPEDEGLDGSASNLDQSAFKRNLRVVIVKAPENKGLGDAALQLARSASEDKTAVYILNKQTDLSELQNKLSQLQENDGSKPEVHFVKYRTPEEAQFAQQSIQNQFDQTYQGPTQVSDEGVAPVENYVGSAGGSNGGFNAGGNVAGGFNGGSFVGVSSSGAGGFESGVAQSFPSVTNQYLPSNRF